MPDTAHQRERPQDQGLSEQQRAELDALWSKSSSQIRDSRFTQQAPHSARTEPAFE